MAVGSRSSVGLQEPTQVLLRAVPFSDCGLKQQSDVEVPGMWSCFRASSAAVKGLGLGIRLK